MASPDVSTNEGLTDWTTYPANIYLPLKVPVDEGYSALFLKEDSSLKFFSSDKEITWFALPIMREGIRLNQKRVT